MIIKMFNSLRIFMNLRISLNHLYSLEFIPEENMHIPLLPAYSGISHLLRRLLIHVTERGNYQFLWQIHHIPRNYFNEAKSEHIFNTDHFFFPPMINCFPPFTYTWSCLSLWNTDFVLFGSVTLSFQFRFCLQIPSKLLIFLTLSAFYHRWI